VNDPKRCQHEQFTCESNVFRTNEKEGMPVSHFAVEFKLKCSECGQPFRFRCTRLGLNFDEPTVSVDGEELRISVHPADGSLPFPPKVKGFRIKSF
jgi:hypothetical protein